MRIEFLLEESSMEYFLVDLLPRILPQQYQVGVNCFLRPHNGKSDLQKSIPKKIRTFSNFYEEVKVVIVHDQDNNNCVELKNQLVSLCNNNGTCSKLVRIACRELEAWYLGDLSSLQQVYPDFNSLMYQNKAKFRNPDILQAVHEVKKIIPNFQKVAASKVIGKHISISQNKSGSYNKFLKGLESFL